MATSRSFLNPGPFRAPWLTGAMIDTRDMPLRLVVETFIGSDQWRWERLECGHSERQRHSGLGYRTTAKRRRCWQCAHGRPVQEG